MNDNDPYQSWLEKRRSLDVSDGFSKKIVAQIRRDQQARQRQNPNRPIALLLEWISLRPLAQSAIITAAAIAGALRVILILQIVFYFN
jgi:hypothetical protein